MGKTASLGDKLVARALAVAFHPCESPGRSVVQFLNTLARTSQHSLKVRIRREGRMHHRQQHQRCDGRLNRPKGAIRPHSLWIPAKLAAAREHYDRAQEGHSYVYSQ